MYICGQNIVIEMNFLYFVLPIVAYLLGSISSAVWVAWKYGINIREHGSGNAGATNILRVLGPKAALPVFIFDFLKGFGAVKLVYLTPLVEVESPEAFTGFQIILGICAILGHIYPIFASFKGGKGVATIAGVLLAITTFPMLTTLGVFIITLIISKYVSFGSIMAALSFPFLVIVVYGIFLTPEKISCTLKIFSIIASALIIFTHRANIKRLRAGTESKISFKKG